MPHLSEEICRARQQAAAVRCAAPDGRPVPGLTVLVERLSSEFTLGARWSGEGSGALDQLAALPGAALVPGTWTPTIREAFTVRGLRVLTVLSAPEEERSLATWSRAVLAPAQERFAGYPRLLGWGLDESWPHADLARIDRAIEQVRARTDGPVYLTGLKLPVTDAVPEADGYGITLGGDGAPPVHLAVLRRQLQEATERMGPCFLYDAGCPRVEDAHFMPRARQEGGREWVEAEYLSRLIAVALSVPGVTGCYLACIAEPGLRPRTSLLSEDMLPKRTYRALQSFLVTCGRPRSQGVTGEDGTFRWETWAGEYRVRAFRGEKPVGELRERLAAGAVGVEWELSVAG